MAKGSLTGSNFNIKLDLDISGALQEINSLKSALSELSNSIKTVTPKQGPLLGATNATNTTGVTTSSTSKTDKALSEFTTGIERATSEVKQQVQTLQQTKRQQQQQQPVTPASASRPSGGISGGPGGGGSGGSGGGGGRPPAWFDRTLWGSGGDGRGDRNFFAKRLGSVATYTVAARTVSAAIAGGERAVSVVKEVEQATTQLNKFLDTNKAKLLDLKQAAIETSKQYGMTTAEVLKGFTIFAQQGMKPEEVKKLGRTVAMASNVSEFNTQELSEIIATGLKTFGPELQNNATRIIDSFLAVEGKFAVTEKDLADVMQRIGPQAKTLGVSFDQLNALTTILKEQTRAPSGEIATSLRFITKNLFDPKVMKSLNERFGLEFKEGGGLRGAFDVLQDISKLYPSLNREQQLFVAGQIAETRHVSKFMGLMQGMGDSTDIVTISQNANGESLRRNNIVMNSVSAQAGKTKAAFEALALAVGDNLLQPTNLFLRVLERSANVLEGMSRTKIPVISQAVDLIDMATGTAQSETTGFTVGNAAGAVGGLGLLKYLGALPKLGTMAGAAGAVGGAVGLTGTVATAGGAAAIAGAGYGIYRLVARLLESPVDAANRKGFVTERERAQDTFNAARDVQKTGSIITQMDRAILLARQVSETDEKGNKIYLQQEKENVQARAKAAGKLEFTEREAAEIREREGKNLRNIISENEEFFGNRNLNKGQVSIDQDSGNLYFKGRNINEDVEAREQFVEFTKGISSSLLAINDLGIELEGLSENLKNTAKEGGSFSKYLEAVFKERTGEKLTVRDKNLLARERATGEFTAPLLQKVMGQSLLSTRELDMKALTQQISETSSDDLKALATLLIPEATDLKGNVYQPGFNGAINRGVSGSILGTLGLSSPQHAEYQSKVLTQALLGRQLQSIEKEMADTRYLDTFSRSGQAIPSLSDRERAMQEIRTNDRIKLTDQTGDQLVGQVIAKNNEKLVQLFKETGTIGSKKLASVSTVPLDQLLQTNYKSFDIFRNRGMASSLLEPIVTDTIRTGFGSQASLMAPKLNLGHERLSDMADLLAGTFTGRGQGGAPEFNVAIQRVGTEFEKLQKDITESLAKREAGQEEASTEIRDLRVREEAVGLFLKSVESFGSVIKVFDSAVKNFSSFQISQRVGREMSSVLTGPLAKLGGEAPAVKLGKDWNELSPYERYAARRPDVMSQKQQYDAVFEQLRQVRASALERESTIREMIQGASTQALSSLQVDEIGNYLKAGEDLMQEAITSNPSGREAINRLSNVNQLNALSSDDQDTRNKAIQELDTILTGRIKAIGESAKGVYESNAADVKILENNIKAGIALETLAKSAEDASRSIANLEKFGGLFKNQEKALGQGSFGVVGAEATPLVLSTERGESASRASAVEFRNMNKFEIQRETLRLLSSNEVKSGSRVLYDEGLNRMEPITQKQADDRRRVIDLQEQKSLQGEKQQRSREVASARLEAVKSLAVGIEQALPNVKNTNAKAGLQNILSELTNFSKTPLTSLLKSNGEINLNKFRGVSGVGERIESFLPGGASSPEIANLLKTINGTGGNSSEYSPITARQDAGNQLLQQIANNTGGQSGKNPDTQTYTDARGRTIVTGASIPAENTYSYTDGGGNKITKSMSEMRRGSGSYSYVDDQGNRVDKSLSARSSSGMFSYVDGSGKVVKKDLEGQDLIKKDIQAKLFQALEEKGKGLPGVLVDTLREKIKTGAGSEDLTQYTSEYLNKDYKYGNMSRQDYLKQYAEKEGLQFNPENVRYKGSLGWHEGPLTDQVPDADIMEYFNAQRGNRGWSGQKPLPSFSEFDQVLKGQQVLGIEQFNQAIQAIKPPVATAAFSTEPVVNGRSTLPTTLANIPSAASSGLIGEDWIRSQDLLRPKPKSNLTDTFTDSDGSLVRTGVKPITRDIMNADGTYRDRDGNYIRTGIGDGMELPKVAAPTDRVSQVRGAQKSESQLQLDTSMKKSQTNQETVRKSAAEDVDKYVSAAKSLISGLTEILNGMKGAVADGFKEGVKFIGPHFTEVIRSLQSVSQTGKNGTGPGGSFITREEAQKFLVDQVVSPVSDIVAKTSNQIDSVKAKISEIENNVSRISKRDLTDSENIPIYVSNLQRSVQTLEMQLKDLGHQVDLHQGQIGSVMSRTT